MKKAIIVLAAILAMAGIVVGCVFWYRSATAGLGETQGESLEQPSATPTEEPTPELTATPTPSPTPEPTVTPIEEEPLFTLKEYPKVDASLAIHPLVDRLRQIFWA